MVHPEEKQHGDRLPVRVGITHGDINGISYEVIMKTFSDQRMLDHMVAIIYGATKIASYHRKTLNISDFNFNPVKSASGAQPKRPNIINITNDEVKIELGKSTETAGQMAFLALETAVADLQHDQIDVLVTAPINKKNMQAAKFGFPGHTEYLAEKFNAASHLMLMVGGGLRIGVVTGHIPLKEVPSALNQDLILDKIQIMHDSLTRDFAVRRPRIAILGLNPHAGDGGVLGNEEQDILLPAIEMAKGKGILAFGPYPADGFFGSDSFRKFDGILAMYHDQGLVPFKALAFNKGVNFTAGLSCIRTSPVHGTAYDLAGKGEASPESFREAVFLAIEIFNNRKMYEELHENPLPNYLKDLESSSDAVIEKELPPAGEEGEEEGIIPGTTTVA